MTHFFLYVCSIQTFDNYSLVNKSFPVSGTDYQTAIKGGDYQILKHSNEGEKLSNECILT